MTEVNKTRELIGLIFLFAPLVGCSEESDNTYTITGEYFLTTFDSLTRVLDEQRTSSASVVVSYTKVNDEGEIEHVELASANFVDNRVRLEGEIDKPTSVQISVHDGEEEVSSTSALIVPGEEVDFAYERFVGLGSDSLTVDLLGVARTSKNPAKKFTISGDFRDLDEDLHLGRVFVQWKIYPDDEFKTQVQVRHSVKINDYKFLLEADIDEPTVANVIVFSLSNSHFGSFVDIVLEPRAEIWITASEFGDHLVATANHGRHFELINSWSQSEEYLKKSLAYEKAVAEFQPELRSTGGSEELSFPVDEGKVYQSFEDRYERDFINRPETIDNETPREIARPEQLEASESSLQPAADCDHLVLDLVQLNDYKETDTDVEPEHRALERELNQIRKAALRDLAINTEDPINALLAMELGAFSSNSQNRHEAFPIFDKLNSLLNANLAAQRVAPLRQTLQHAIDKKVNRKKLVFGQTVPSFKLPTLQGTEITLSEVLNKNVYVLVEFWASWCDPCTSRFPSLKHLHTLYKDNGFEIVGISIDSTPEDWKASSEEHNITWTNLGEIEGWNGPIAKTYGVSFLPDRYLVDSNGCILMKDVTAYELKEYLASQFETGKQ